MPLFCWSNTSARTLSSIFEYPAHHMAFHLPNESRQEDRDSVEATEMVRCSVLPRVAGSPMSSPWASFHLLEPTRDADVNWTEFMALQRDGGAGAEGKAPPLFAFRKSCLPRIGSTMLTAITEMHDDDGAVT